MHDRIISLRGGDWALKNSLTPPYFIEVPVSYQESERSCICVLVVCICVLVGYVFVCQWYVFVCQWYLFCLTTDLIFDVGIALTMWYFFSSFYERIVYTKISCLLNCGGGVYNYVSQVQVQHAPNKYRIYKASYIIQNTN